MFIRNVPTRGLTVNEILNLVCDKEGQGVHGFYLNPPEGDDSEGYDDSDIEEGDPVLIHKNLLEVRNFDISLNSTMYRKSSQFM